MEFRILGSLEVVDDRRLVEIGGPKPRALLAVLLLHANEVVSSDVLIDALWGERPPPTASKTLQAHVSRLRKALGNGLDGGSGARVQTRGPGYLLQLGAGELDADLARERLGSARRALAEGEPQVAADAVREALRLWRGAPLADFAYESFAQAEIARLEELKHAVEEEWVETELALGRHAELVPELEALVIRNPLRERLLGQLMVALYRSGRQAEALNAFQEGRRALAEELGLQPSERLRALERQILDHDPVLELVASGAQAATTIESRPSVQPRSSSFVGRTRELREIRELLGREDVRLLTLTGPGGAGKTRLALEATSTLDGERGSVVLVELARINDARLVARTIADELGVEERPGQSAREALLEYLQGRQTLLVLDNYEHVLSAAPLARELARAPGVKVLVTSRAPLDVPEERVVPVPALELPDPSPRTALARLRRTEAVRLFVDRARAVRPDFELTETNARSVAELCVRLDGLPLAIELAAARCNLLSPAAMLERLDSRLDLLRAAPGSGMSERQWTLRAAIEWSYELLGPQQQQLFTSLGVFVGGFTLAAAELVADQPELDIVEGAESLLRNNLLTTEHTRGDEPRLGMLETIREYALERLATRGDDDAVRRRHADFCLMLAEAAEPGLRGPDQREWLDRLDADRGNIRAALTWAQHAGEAETGLRIGSGLWRFWQLRSSVQEARGRLEELLALGSGSTVTRATARTELANLAALQGDRETARRLLEESLPVHRQEGNAFMVGHTLGLLGHVALTEGEIDSALALYREVIEVARGTSPWLEASTLWRVGVCLALRGELDDAERTLEEAVDLVRQQGDARNIGGSLTSLGGVALMRGDHERARPLFDESLALFRSMGDAAGISNALGNVAFLALEEGDAETARPLLAEALAIEKDAGERFALAKALEMSARLAAGRGHLALAIRLYARAALLRVLLRVRWEYDLGLPDPMLQIADLRSRVDEATFAEEWERGRAMSLLQAIDEARGNDGDLDAHASRRSGAGDERGSPGAFRS
jgi:predicted ATPase/DNA-binding SARP family transcriptional activator